MTIEAHQGSALAIRDDQEFWNDKQLSALRQLGVSDAGNGDLAVFFHQAQRTGLDPFARQIYMVGRWSREGTKYAIQTGIDGFRLIGRRAADAHRETLEVSDTEWCGPDGRWVDVWLASEPPAAARVAIIRNGGRFPAVALFSEYAQTKKDGGLTQMWETKPALMLAKCAEALAWRKAFPQDLSGLYTTDEMGQADNQRQRAAVPAPQRLTVDMVRQDGPPPASPASADDPAGITDAQTRKMGAQMRKVGLTDRAESLAFVARVLGREVASRSDLTKAEASDVIEALTLWETDGADPTTGLVEDQPEVVDAEVVEGDPWAVQP